MKVEGMRQVDTKEGWELRRQQEQAWQAVSPPHAVHHGWRLACIQNFKQSLGHGVDTGTTHLHPKGARESGGGKGEWAEQSLA